MIEWRNAAQTDVRELSERSGDLEGEDAERWKDTLELFDECERQIPEVEANIATIERVVDAEERATVPPVDPNARRAPVPGVDEGPFAQGREFLPPTEVRDHAVRAIAEIDNLPDSMRESAMATLDQADDRSGSIARRIVVTGRPEYRAAFAKVLSGRMDEFTPEESAAVQSMRAASLTDAAGGYAVPFLLDETVVDTGSHNGLASSIRSISRIVTGTSDVWNGVSSAGVTASWDAEGQEVSDDAPTFAQPSITAHKGQGFIPFSVEIQGDSSLEDDFRRMLSIARADLEEEAFTTGSGTGQPKGIVTALSGSYEESTATNDTFAGADLYTLHDALAARFRGRAQWLANIAIIGAIRQFDTDGGSDFKVEPGLTAGAPATLLGRPLTEAPFMASAVADAADILILADMMSAYYIYDRVGMSVELVPHLFGAQGRPTGQRGLLAWWRTGADLVNSTAARLLTVQ